MEKQNVIIDTDPGVDDAVAIMYALTCDNLNINLLSSAGGNSPIKNITENTLHILDLLGKDVPVVQGAATPLKRPPAYPTGAQGKSGLGSTYDYDRTKLKHKTINGESCDVIYKQLKKNNSPTSIVSIGPMTNIAKMILKYPDCKKYIKEVIFESGTKEKIYGKPYKSFNTGYDPEATETVFKSGVPLVMVPMELGHIAYLDHDDIKRFKKTNKTGKAFAKMFKGYRDFHVGDLGAAVHDTCAVYYLTHPEYIKTEKAFIDVKYYKTDVDDYGYIDIDFNKTPNATVCIDLDIEMLKYDIFKALEMYE